MPLKLGTQQAEARVLGIQRTLDAVTLESGTGTDGRGQACTRWPRSASACASPSPSTSGGKVPALGRFVLMRGRRIAGGGVIDSRSCDEPRGQPAAGAP